MLPTLSDPTSAMTSTTAGLARSMASGTEPGVHSADERGIEAHARHPQEVALAGPPDRYPPGAPGGDHVSDRFRVAGQVQLPRQDIGGAARPHGERDRIPDERLHGLVHRAFSTADGDHPRAGRGGFAAETRGVAGRRGRTRFRAEAAGVEQIDHPRHGLVRL